jgi:hypothetical protein
MNLVVLRKLETTYWCLVLRSKKKRVVRKIVVEMIKAKASVGLRVALYKR